MVKAEDGHRRLWLLSLPLPQASLCDHGQVASPLPRFSHVQSEGNNIAVPH